jgi:predicted PurR-regulated permease PerM
MLRLQEDTEQHVTPHAAGDLWEACPMGSRSRVIDVSFATFMRALGAIALAWMWFRLWQWVLVFVLAAFLAVALDPAVRWLEKRGVRRAYGALLIALCLVLVVAGFIVASGASIAEQTRVLGDRIDEFRQTVLTRVPKALQQAGSSMAPSAESLTRMARAFGGGIAGIAVAFIVTVYLLLEGRRTYRWLVAFVPPARRPRVEATAACAREVIAAYVRGNVITSVLCAAITWIVLAAMHVPAALVLALLAGLLDFVPVVGFILSAAPAVLLGFTVSPMVALAVATFYVLYNIVENYYIQPKVYGRELRLSDLAVIAAFLVGAELGGVLGAVIALPVAAMYPAVERIWFDRPGETDTADEHRRMESQRDH